MDSPLDTADHLLGGRVRFSQPAEGYRVAIDPILLAASVEARPGGRILDAGCGTGAAALCLAARVPDCILTGVELDPELARFARANIAANGMEGRIAIAETSFADFAKANRAAFDQVLANPPFYESGSHTASPHSTKASAHTQSNFELDGWIKASRMVLKPGGRLTLIHRADRLAHILAALEGRFGAALIFPLWRRAGGEAKRVIVSAIAGRRTLPRILAGLVLHEANGAYTDEAQAILRDGGRLDLEPRSA